MDRPDHKAGLLSNYNLECGPLWEEVQYIGSGLSLTVYCRLLVASPAEYGLNLSGVGLDMQVGNIVLLRMMLVPRHMMVWRDAELETSAKLRAVRALIHTAWRWEEQSDWSYEVLGCRATGGHAKLCDLLRAGVTRFRYLVGGESGLKVDIAITSLLQRRRDVIYPRLLPASDAQPDDVVDPARSLRVSRMCSLVSESNNRALGS